jgi:hypothetical protein
MKRFIEGENRFQSTLFPESLEDYIAKDNSGIGSLGKHWTSPELLLD